MTARVKKKALQDISNMKQDNPVYVPLMRRGDYFLSGKTPDGDRFETRYPTSKERNRAKKQLAENGYTIRKSGKQAVKQVTNRDVMPSIEEILDTDTFLDLDSKVQDDVRDMLSQAYFNRSGANSRLQNQVHRNQLIAPDGSLVSGLSGFSGDQYQNMQEYGNRVAVWCLNTGRR